MDDEEDIFSDTISVNSYSSTKPRINNRKDYISLSRNTIYHSAEDIELAMADFNNQIELEDSHSHRINDKSWSKFQDGERSVDFVLAYISSDNSAHIRKREIYENNLIEQKLVLEREQTQKLHFIKIHAPREVLCKFTEILKLRMPIKDFPDLENKDCDTDLISGVSTAFDSMLGRLGVKLDKKLFPDQKYTPTEEFSRDKSYLFATESENFFSTSVKCMVVNFILEREKFNDDPSAVLDVGIGKLLADNVYKAAYPLHDGSTKKVGSERALLLEEWASVNKWVKYQPIDNLKDYFGVKFALYFAWLGFYTHMLIPASIVGIICVLFGVATLSWDSLSNDICDPKINYTMCPQCDKFCDYWNLIDACTYAKITHLFDNNLTVFFAFFMSIWSALYLELWKRYSAEITHRWGLTGFDLRAEHPRPQYLARLTNFKKKRNILTNIQEPTVPFCRVKLPTILLSFTVALLWVFLALAAVFGVVLYRMASVTSHALYEDKSSSYKTLLIPCTAGLINLACIVTLNFVYNHLAVWLTEREFQRTETEFDDSLTLKIYMFQFVNYYSSIFYIAFMKGKLVGYPAKYNRIFGYRQEECSPGGCLMELCIQLSIIMIGNQAMNSILEILIPFLTKLYNSFRTKTGIERKSSDDDLICCNQWTEDYKLIGWDSRGLFTEYLEMVLQYGFVTIFVTAFPLAPLFALINNVFEMRLDAKKFIKYCRRPVIQRVKDIGIWFPIIDAIGRIAVVSNAFIIAFSSNFIPHLVYLYDKEIKESHESFLDHGLSYFNVVDFKKETGPIQTRYSNITECRYAEYRNPPWHEDKYKRPPIYWHILAARLAFVVVYQNVVSFVIMMVQWAIPDIPRRLRDRIKCEALRTSEIIIKHETLHAKCSPNDERKGDLDTNGKPGHNKLTNRRRPNEQENLV